MALTSNQYSVILSTLLTQTFKPASSCRILFLLNLVYLCHPRCQDFVHPQATLWSHFKFLQYTNPRIWTSVMNYSFSVLVCAGSGVWKACPEESSPSWAWVCTWLSSAPAGFTDDAKYTWCAAHLRWINVLCNPEVLYARCWLLLIHLSDGRAFGMFLSPLPCVCMWGGCKSVSMHERGCCSMKRTQEMWALGS